MSAGVSGLRVYSYLLPLRINPADASSQQFPFRETGSLLLLLVYLVHVSCPAFPLACVDVAAPLVLFVAKPQRSFGSLDYPVRAVHDYISLFFCVVFSAENLLSQDISYPLFVSVAAFFVYLLFRVGRHLLRLASFSLSRCEFFYRN